MLSELALLGPKAGPASQGCLAGVLTQQPCQSQGVGWLPEKARRQVERGPSTIPEALPR